MILFTLFYIYISINVVHVLYYYASDISRIITVARCAISTAARTVPLIQDGGKISAASHE